jgi:hypothetical protein
VSLHLRPDGTLWSRAKRHAEVAVSPQGVLHFIHGVSIRWSTDRRRAVLQGWTCNGNHRFWRLPEPGTLYAICRNCTSGHSPEAVAKILGVTLDELLSEPAEAASA